MASFLGLTEEVGIEGKKKGKSDSMAVDTLAGEGSTADKLKEARKKKKKRLDEIMKAMGQ